MKTVFRIGGVALALSLAVPTARADQAPPPQANKRVAPAAPRPVRPPIAKPPIVKPPPARPLAVKPVDDPAPQAAAPEATIAIPFEKYTLANGLTVILSERRDLPMVVVDVIVKVGSRFEPKGRTGFAHLFEHLMFMGTNRVPTGAFDQWMEAEGAANNAWTSEDRTNYFSFGPSHALPLLLWLEADRLTSLGASMTQERLDAQRGVVRNERRQTSENEPYGKAELLLPELLYPAGHPYHHPVLGSHEDLEAATVADVKTFFATHYVPANMALVVAGDFDLAETKSSIEKWFGLLGAGTGGDESTRAAAVVPAASAAPRLGSVVRKTVTENNIQLPKIILAWHSPPRFAPGDAELDLLSNVLVRGKTSRLHQVLVFEKELAQTVTASQSSQDLSGVFTIEAVARPGVSLDTLEAEIDKVLTALVEKGPTTKEIERAKIDYETSFVLGLESLPSRASSLALYESFAGDPGFIGKDLARYRAVDVAAAHSAAKATLDLGSRVILRIEPEKAPSSSPSPAAKGGAQ